MNRPHLPRRYVEHLDRAGIDIDGFARHISSAELVRFSRASHAAPAPSAGQKPTAQPMRPNPATTSKLQSLTPEKQRMLERMGVTPEQWARS